MYVRFPLSLRGVESRRHKRGIDSVPVHNRFNHERHRNRGDDCKQSRAAALAKWRSLGAA